MLDDSTLALTSGSGSGGGASEANAGDVVAELTHALQPRIRVLHKLGEGGMGWVYLGRDELLQRSVAIKVLSPELAGNDVARARFIREAQAAAAVTHPNVVAIHEVGTLPASQLPYFVMQFIEGRSLDERLPEGQPIGGPETRRLVGEIAGALAAAHARGLVHRDIKPANIMLERSSGRAIVVDFGISAVVDPAVAGGGSALTVEGTYVGTPTYTSPEQAAGLGVSERSDVYSLGVLAFRATTGTLPFNETSAIAMLAAHIKDPPPSVRTLRPDLDARFADLIDRCLAKEPGRRPTASDIASYLVPPAQPAIEWPPPGLEPLRGRAAEFALALGGGCVLALLLTLLLSATPTLSSARWYVPEQSEFWRWVTTRVAEWQGSAAAARDAAVLDPTPLWLFSLAVVFLGMIVALAAAIARGVKLASRLALAARAGYPLGVALDVAWDFRQDTAALLNGTGDYALLGLTERLRLLHLRRAQSVAVTATLVAATVLPFVWIGLALGRRAASEPILVQSAESSAYIVMLLIGVLAIIATGLMEARAVAAARGWRTFVGMERGTLPPRGEIVAAWMRSGRWRWPAGSMSRVMPIVVGVIAIGITFAMIVTTTAVMMVSAASADRSRRARDSAITWLDRRRSAAPASVAVATTSGEDGRPDSSAAALAISGATGGRWLALMADPENPPGLALIGDTAVSASERARLVYAVVPAFCLHPREVLLGLNPRREEILDRIDERPNAPSLHDAVRAARRSLREWLGSARGVRGVKKRMNYCRGYG